ncbi:zinc ribbon domain-containing protein [Streptomyces niger]|uniref:zinc ribbon domain-containing protein n=1 Tax=Streptomyces niger TaxID=66373 RepID=UPI0018FED95F|nr:zinc ribbon domain-containing protein [Streptomyces niger]
MTSLPAEARPLHAHTAQAVAYDLAEAIVLGRRNRQQGVARTKLPWRQKSYRRLVFTTGFGWKITRDGRLALSLGRGRERIVLPVPEFPDRQGETVAPDRWGEMKLCWDAADRSWSLRVAYRAPDDGLPDAGDRSDESVPDMRVVTVAVDEGLINPMALATRAPDGGYEVAVINGRSARSLKQRRNKGVAQLQAKSARCSNGSRRHRRLAAARKKLTARTDRSLRDFNHQVTAKANRFIREQVSAHERAAPAEVRVMVRLVVGNVRGIERNTERKRRNARSTRQQLSQWERGTQERQLAYKTGLVIRHVDEAYSSQTCPYCLTRCKVRGRTYACVNSDCSRVLHRDAVGGVNIHTLAVNDGAYVPVAPGIPVRVKYLRALPGWSCDQRGRHSMYQRARLRAGPWSGREARSSARNRATRVDASGAAGVAVSFCEGRRRDREDGVAAPRGAGRAGARTA